MNLFKIYKEDRHIIFNIFGLKIRIKNPHIDYIGEMCLIPKREYFEAQNTFFVHPIGVSINKDVVVGKDCIIFQNVVIGAGKYNEERKTKCPILGNNVVIYANAVLAGGIKVGDNAVIGAGSVVMHDVPENAVVVGNPAKFLRYRKDEDGSI